MHNIAHQIVVVDRLTDGTFSMTTAAHSELSVPAVKSLD